LYFTSEIAKPERHGIAATHFVLSGARCPVKQSSPSVYTRGAAFNMSCYNSTGDKYMTIIYHLIENLLAPVSMDTASLAYVIVMKITLAILNAPPLRLTLRAKSPYYMLRYISRHLRVPAITSRGAHNVYN
jgi:hypothetical protein